MDTKKRHTNYIDIIQRCKQMFFSISKTRHLSENLFFKFLIMTHVKMVHSEHSFETKTAILNTIFLDHNANVEKNQVESGDFCRYTALEKKNQIFRQKRHTRKKISYDNSVHINSKFESEKEKNACGGYTGVLSKTHTHKKKSERLTMQGAVWKWALRPWKIQNLEIFKTETHTQEKQM